VRTGGCRPPFVSRALPANLTHVNRVTSGGTGGCTVWFDKDFSTPGGAEPTIQIMPGAVWLSAVNSTRDGVGKLFAYFGVVSFPGTPWRITGPLANVTFLDGPLRTPIEGVTEAF